MKRMKVLFGQRRIMVLATLAILVLTAAALVASSASFTATSANPGNMFTAGTLTMSNDKADTAVLTADLMVPGQDEVGTVTVGNTGDVAGRFSLEVTKSALVDETELKAFGGKLRLTITDGAAFSWSGTVDQAVAQSPLALGDIAGGASRTYTITALFPDAGVDLNGVGLDNGYMGGRVTADFTWNAVNTPAP